MFHRDLDTEAARTYVPPRMSEKQLRALEWWIMHSKNASEFAKRAIIWALRQTNGLTMPVALSMPAHFSSGSGREVAYAAHDMYSVNGTTRIDVFINGMGTEMGLSHHGGTYTRASADANEAFDFRGDGYTIWWSHTWYDHTAKRLELPSSEVLMGISVEGD